MYSKFIIALVVLRTVCSLPGAEKAKAYEADWGVTKTPWGQLHAFDRMRAKRSVPPSYPIEIKRDGVKHELVLGVLVGEDGAVQDVKVLKSSGEGDLDRSALIALKSWKYYPLSPRERFVTIQPVVFDPE